MELYRLPPRPSRNQIAPEGFSRGWSGVASLGAGRRGLMPEDRARL